MRVSEVVNLGAAGGGAVVAAQIDGVGLCLRPPPAGDGFNVDGFHAHEV